MGYDSELPMKPARPSLRDMLQGVGKTIKVSKSKRQIEEDDEFALDRNVISKVRKRKESQNDENYIPYDELSYQETPRDGIESFSESNMFLKGYESKKPVSIVASKRPPVPTIQVPKKKQHTNTALKRDPK